MSKGELLAEIDSPEIDQQLSQAVAAREQAAASLQLAKSTMERWEALRKKDAVSQQELDERRSGDGAGAARISPRPTRTSSGCASCRASSASWRPSPASSRGATSTSAT